MCHFSMRQKLRGTFGVLRPNTLKFVRSVSFVRRAATLGGGGESHDAGKS